jgi:replicative DNA helicase
MDPVARAIWQVAYRYDGAIAPAALYEELKTFTDGLKAVKQFPTIESFKEYIVTGQTAGDPVLLAQSLREETVSRSIDEILVYRDRTMEPSKQALLVAERLIQVASRVAPATNAEEFAQALDTQVGAFEWRQLNPDAMPGWRLNEKQYDRFLKSTGGLDGGKLVITAALTGMGKSHWLLFQAVRLAETMREDKMTYPKIAFMSMEMSREDIAARLLGHFARVDYYSATTSPDAFVKIQAAQQRIKNLIADNRFQVYYGITNIDSISRKLHQLKAQGQIDIAVIDYIGMIQSSISGRSNTYQATGDVVKQLQSLALDLNIPIITASQLNRSTYEQTGQRPTLANIADSSIVSMCADVIHMLWRPDQSVKNLVGKNIGLWKNVVVLLTEKTRQGKHQVPMYYHLESSYSNFIPCPIDLVEQLESEEQQTLLHGGFK